MAKETIKKEVAAKEAAAKEVKKETMSYVLTFSDGTVIQGSTSIRQFKPNKEGGFHNSGYQVKVSDGDYSGNIMIIDALKKLFI